MSASLQSLPPLFAPPEFALDLHGLRVPAARESVRQLFKRAQKEEASKVTIVTGIGRHVNSNGQRAVLFNALPKWLEAPEIKGLIKEIRQDMGGYEVVLNNPNTDQSVATTQKIVETLEPMFFPKKTMELIKRKAQEGSAPHMYLFGGLMINGNVVAEDQVEGAKWVERAADAGDPYAQMQMGILCSLGLGVPINYNHSRKWHLKAAEHSAHPQPYSLAALGKYYWLGQGVIKDDKKALDFLTRAADLGEAATAFSLGKIYLYGDKTVGVNGTLAAKYLEIAAKNGLLDAKVLFAKQCFFGWGDVAVNYTKAYSFFLEAGQEGDPIALYYLGRIFSEGLGVQVDQKVAFDWFKKSAELGDKDAEHAVAFALLTGDGVQPCVEEGLKKLENLANAGHINSAALLGELFLFGRESIKIKKDVRLASNYLKVAAEGGLLIGQVLLSNLLLFGDLDVRDSKNGEKWLKAAADQNEPYSLYMLGKMLELSSEAKQCADQIVDLYKRAAGQKYPEALYSLGMLYLEGELAPTDEVKGQALVEEAANEGSARANCYLGKKLVRSKLEEEQKKGAAYFAKSAAKNHVEAFVGLGFCYKGGIGVKPSREKAIEWFKKAADRKDGYALNVMGRIRQEENNLAEALEYFFEAAKAGFDSAVINAAKVCFQNETFYHLLPRILTLLQPLAEKGDAKAALFSAHIYLFPDSGHFNLDEAFKWLRQSFLAGDQEAKEALLGLTTFQGPIAQKALSILSDPQSPAAQKALSILFEAAKAARPTH